MSTVIQISAKTLGQIALPGFCPRCFWLTIKAKKLPFQIFPGIFSSIDSYSKRVVHGWFDREGCPPAWLRDLGEIKGYKNPPHHSNFRIVDPETSIRLTGVPDGIFVMGDGSYVIVDYKTAKCTNAHDELFPLYEAQLNVYGYIGERCQLSPVSKLALIYTEPVTDGEEALLRSNLTPVGFQMGFSAHICPVEIKPDVVPQLLRVARAILDHDLPPARTEGCSNCEAIGELIKLAAM